jgi:hypothetical protein
VITAAIGVGAGAQKRLPMTSAPESQKFEPHASGGASCSSIKDVGAELGQSLTPCATAGHTAQTMAAIIYSTS